jgi:hypothetical protein
VSARPRAPDAQRSPHSLPPSPLVFKGQSCSGLHVRPSFQVSKDSAIGRPGSALSISPTSAWPPAPFLCLAPGTPPLPGPRHPSSAWPPASFLRLSLNNVTRTLASHMVRMCPRGPRAPGAQRSPHSLPPFSPSLQRSVRFRTCTSDPRFRSAKPALSAGQVQRFLYSSPPPPTRLRGIAA